MAIALISFIAVFLLIGSAGLILFYREAMLERITAVTTTQAPKPKGFMGTVQATGLSITNVVEQLEKVMPKSQAEVSVIKTRLVRAGYREESATKVFYGAKILTPLILCLLLLVTGIGHYSFFLYILALGLGFLAPDFWLGNRISARQARIRRGLPDVLDLLVICVEAGLSLDQGTARAAKELRITQPDLSDELSVVSLEQAAGRPRGEAWRNFAERTDVDSVRNLVSVLVQAEKFGTSIARTLRIHSDTLRTQRRQKVEEQAAKTTVKLVFPLVLFIFPSIFLVTLGPAFIIMSESFHKLFTK